MKCLLAESCSPDLVYVITGGGKPKMLHWSTVSDVLLAVTERLGSVINFAGTTKRILQHKM